MPERLGKRVIKLFKKYKCEFVRQGKGDHQIWYSPITNRNISVDAGGKDKNTANSTLRDAGIKERV